MNRRQFLHLTTGAIIGLSGCQRSGDSKSTVTEGHNKVLEIFPKVKKTSDGWLLEATVWNVHAVDTSFHEIHLQSYATDGTEICNVEVGNLIEPTGERKTVEATCAEFPAIVTATAQETPCANASIPIVYWVGTDTQKRGTIASDEIVWEDVYRKCGEELPPQRILDKFETSTKANE